MVRCLGKECGADVNQAHKDGYTPSSAAAPHGHLGVVRCLGKELGAEVNEERLGVYTSLMTAQVAGYGDIVKCLLKMTANPQLRSGAVAQAGDTALTFAISYEATPEQTAYLDLRTHCGNPTALGGG